MNKNPIKQVLIVNGVNWSGYSYQIWRVMWSQELFLFVQHLSCRVDHKILVLINIALRMIIIASYYKALFQSSHIQGCNMTNVVKFIVWFSYASKLSNTLAKKYISVLPDRVIWSITQTKACLSELFSSQYKQVGTSHSCCYQLVFSSPQRQMQLDLRVSLKQHQAQELASLVH